MDPIIGNTRFSKVLKDRGSSLNIMYAHTLELLGIGLDKLCPSKSPFHSVAPTKLVQPLGQIDRPVCFGTAANFRKEVLTFEVVRFWGAYHAILGRPCYAKFMAIPNYTYLKMKMPARRGSSPSARRSSTPMSATSSASSTPRPWRWTRPSPHSYRTWRTKP
jgi:hypothetical protein